MTWKRYLEKYYPNFLGLISCIGSLFLPRIIISEMAQQLSSQVISFFSIVIAFVATSMTILLTAPQHDGIRRIKASPEHYKELISYHSWVVRSGILAALLSLTTLLVYRDTITIIHPVAKTIVFVLWVGSGVAAIAGFYRVVNLMHTLLMPDETEL
jgi:hypothetical protein